MAKQLYYEDVEVGSEILTLTKHPTTQQLVMWAGASRDFNPLHYDKDFAQKLGFKTVLVHGRLKAAFLGQLITDWIGDEGTVKTLTCNYRGNDLPEDDILVKGKVTNKYIKDNEHYVECEIWTENPEGQRTTPGTATVVLPSRG